MGSEMTFQEWFDANRELISQQTLETSLRNAYYAGFYAGADGERALIDLVRETERLGLYDVEFINCSHLTAGVCDKCSIS